MTDERVSLILVDYVNRQRLKIWALANLVEVDQNPELSRTLALPEYNAHVERFFLLKVQAFDWNCPQHIVPRFTCEEIADLDMDAVKSKLKEEKSGCGQ